RRLALAPVLLAAPAPEPGPTGVERLAQRLLVHPPHHEDVTAGLLLDDRRNEPVGVERNRGELGLRVRDGSDDGRRHEDGAYRRPRAPTPRFGLADSTA